MVCWRRGGWGSESWAGEIGGDRREGIGDYGMAEVESCSTIESHAKSELFIQ